MIIKATLQDISALHTLINSGYRGETSKKGWTTEANLLEGERVTNEELTEIILNNNNTILKYTENDQIIGCVLLVNKETKLYLGMLTVSPELQNSGIGKKLLQEAELFALALNLPKIEMTVISIRMELIAWYIRHGYIDTGKRESFPLNITDRIITNIPFDFIVLEKTIQ